MPRVNSPQCAFEVLCHALERQIERRAPSDKHIIMSCAHPGCGPEPHNFTEAAADPLRSTAFPTFFDTVKPNRAGPWSRRLRACSTNAADGALIPDAAARKSARCLNRSMEAMRGLFAAVRRTAVCDHAPGAPTRPCARPWSPYVRGSRDGACVRACSVDRSASRFVLRWLRLGEGGIHPRYAVRPTSSGRHVRFCAAYKGGPVVRQCRGIGGLRQGQIASQGGETRPVRPRARV